MFFTEIGLTQYEIHDNFNPLEEYNRDMRTITNTTTVAAGRVDVVEQESKDRDEALQNDIDTNHNGIVDIENEISDLKAKDIELESKVELNAQDITTLQVTTSSISAQLLSHIETSTSFASGILTEVKDNYAELKTDIMADRERLAVAETAIANIEQGDTEIGERVTELERDNRDNKNAIEALQLVDQSQGESIQDLHNRMTTAESNITANENDITELNGRITTAEQNIEDLQTATTRSGITGILYNGNATEPKLVEYTANASISFKARIADSVNANKGIYDVTFPKVTVVSTYGVTNNQTLFATTDDSAPLIGDFFMGASGTDGYILLDPTPGPISLQGIPFIVTDENYEPITTLHWYPNLRKYIGKVSNVNYNPGTLWRLIISR